MDAVLERIVRKPMQGDENEIAADLACDLDPDEREIRIRTNRDLGIRTGDVLESEALERKMTVSSVRKRRSEEGYLITLGYR